YTLLHWLPIALWVRFKVLVLTYKALHGLGPAQRWDLACSEGPTPGEPLILGTFYSAEKPGRYPRILPTTAIIFFVNCLTNRQCHGTQKCCHYGCKVVCKNPVPCPLCSLCRPTRQPCGVC
uniref:WAP domain-containing protein n=1 Tax=Naja naja TaxID=35670 RepID=A0A8C6Y1L1_NAJNA